MTPSPDTIAAIATPPGRGGIGVVRVSGGAVPAIAAALVPRTLPPRVATLATFRGARGEAARPGPRALLSRAALLHRRARAGAARPRRPGGAAAAAGALPRARRAARPARRVHAARVPQRQARPRAGRGRRGPHRRRDRDRRPRRGAQPDRRVLGRDPRAGRRARSSCGCSPRRRSTSPTRTSTSCAPPTRGESSARSARVSPPCWNRRGPGRCCATGSRWCWSASPTSASRAS